MEIVVRTDSHRVPGGTILGVGNEEAIHSVLYLIANDATAEKLHLRRRDQEVVRPGAPGRTRTDVASKLRPERPHSNSS
jgi:hypothetical protein